MGARIPDILMRRGSCFALAVVLVCGLVTYALSVFTMRRVLWLPIFLSGVFVVDGTAIAPKVVIVNFYSDEANIWHGIPEFDILAQNISVPGLSSKYPEVHCTADGEICQVVTDEGEINAAATTTAFVFSPLFDLSKSYFLLGGVAGISPKMGTLGSVAFARFSVQVALQYELDAREKPEGASTGYIPQGTTGVGQYPRYIYGTEVYELNDALRQHAINFARNATLNDTLEAQAYRALYDGGDSDYSPATATPSVVACDTGTSDVWYSGALLAEAFENTTRLFTNGSATFCTTQQEDTGVLAPLLRGNVAGLVDFKRVIAMRTASDFDRPAPGMQAADNLFNGQNAGYGVSITNIYVAGVQVVQGLLAGWDDTFAGGVKPTNYVGDIRGSLGGTPDFGPDS
ncbi:purine nucleoside permease [Peniophora sp. CONT]|nr:purine nucleoside permease [Peniophora sp. CONT]